MVITLFSDPGYINIRKRLGQIMMQFLKKSLLTF